jgi:amidohydrolase
MDRAEMKRRIWAAVDENSAEIERIARTVYEHPELGYKENFGTEFVAGELQRLGLDVETGIAVTGVRARSSKSSSGPRIAIMGELDSIILPDHPAADKSTGAVHACGHHLQIGAMMGAAIGLVRSGVLEQLDGVVEFLAVPAEEYVELGYRAELKERGEISFFGGKQEMIKRGLFDSIDAVMMIHSLDQRAGGTKLIVGPEGNGFIGKNVRFIGVPSHAGAAPEKGVNALNAAMLGMMNIHALRETFPDSQRVRVHPMLTKGGDIVNIVPADVRMESYVRAATTEYMQKVNKDITRALTAGAMAVGARVEIQDIPGYLPLLDTPELDELFISNALEFVTDDEIQRGAVFSGSFDIGDVSHLLPVLHPMVGGIEGDLHSLEFKLTDPETALRLPARVMAATAVDLLAEGAAAMKKISSTFTPALTKEEYLSFMATVDSVYRGP